MEDSIYSLFFASSDSRNSLRDMFNLRRSKDRFLINELESAIGNRKDFLDLLKEEKFDDSKIYNNVFSFTTSADEDIEDLENEFLK